MDQHRCVGRLPYRRGPTAGPAIEECLEDEHGCFWVGNDEYDSQVNFCPYCGAKAPVQVSDLEARTKL